MISTTLPTHNSPLTIVACYVQCGGKSLLLRRNPEKAHGNKWGLPGGKANAHETPTEAIVRELMEETGVEADTSEITELPTLWVEHEDTSFNYHSFHLKLKTAPPITLSPGEHIDYKWVTLEESLGMDLIHDLEACTRLFFKL